MFAMMITGATVVVIVELTESGVKPRAITSVLLAVVVRADVVSGKVVADVVSMIVVEVVLVVEVVEVEVLVVVEVVVITADVVVVVVEVVVEAFVAGKVTGSVTFITAGTISATDFALLVLMLEDAVVVEVGVEVVVEFILVVGDDDFVDVVIEETN